MIAWMCVVSILGVLLAFPMKRRFINEEQLPFPEGRAAAWCSTRSTPARPAAGMFKARLLGCTALCAGIYQVIVSDGWMKLAPVQDPAHGPVGGHEGAVDFPRAPRHLLLRRGREGQLYIPTILGTDIRALGLRLTLDVAMLGVGGLMGIAVATSCLLGAFVNFVILAPIMIQAGDIAARIGPTGAMVPISRAEIVNQWSLWWGVTMMVVGSLVSLLGAPGDLQGPLQAQRQEGRPAPMCSQHIEFPLWISAVGVPIFSVLGAWVTHAFFGVPWLLAFISLPLIFVLSIICTNSMALTSWTPTGALSKITQFTMGAIDRTNPASNLIPAGMTAEIAANASNLLSDIKPGYMLGAKPRQQAIGHVIGIFAGAIALRAAVLPALPAADANGVRSASTIDLRPLRDSGGDAVEGRGRADRQGRQRAAPFGDRLDDRGGGRRGRDRGRAHRHQRPVPALRRVDRPGRGAAARVHLRDVGRRDDLLVMKRSVSDSRAPKGHRFWVEGMEPICAGLISGSALMGIGNAIVNVLMG